MLLKHNKKRNIGLLNEFFARYIGRAIIEQQDLNVQKGKILFKKHFNKGTSLYKELKLFNALYNTRIENKEAAYSLIKDAKKICQLQSQQVVDLEKTALLHEINSTLNDPDFFNRGVVDYKIHATIQLLLNHWRMGVLNENLGETSKLEDKLIEHLTMGGSKEESKKEVKNVLGMTNEDVNQLVVNIMVEKLNAKFGTLLNEEQKKVLNLYMFSKENEKNKKELSCLLEAIKNRVSDLLVMELKKSTNDFTNKKLKQIQELILKEEKTVDLTDETISFYLATLKLEKEIKDASA